MSYRRLLSTRKGYEKKLDPVGIYLLKVNNRNTWRRSGVFIVNFEHISHLVLVFIVLTLSRLMPTGEV